MPQIQAAPSPRTVSWRNVVRAAADPLGPHQAGERGGGLEGRDDAGGFPVPDRAAVLVELVLGEEDRELDLPGACPAVLALPVPSCCFLRGHRDAGAVDDGVELVRQRVWRQRDHLAGGDEPGAAPAGGRDGGAAGLGRAPDPPGGQPDPGQLLQRPRGPGERAGGGGHVVHRGQAGRHGRAGDAELGVARGQAVPAFRAVVPGAIQGDGTEDGVDDLLPVAGEHGLMTLAARDPGPRWPGSAASSCPSMPQPAASIPARITASAAPRASSPQPSDRAASAARRPTSADFSAASALKSPLFRPPARRARPRRPPALPRRSSRSPR